MIVGKNDLLSSCPDIATEWNYEKNGDLLPSQVAKSSGKKVWWYCKVCGNEWQDTINHRYSGRSCPKCMRERHTSFPEQAILFYLKKITTAIGQFKFDNKFEIDIYLPELKIGIEYDGMAFHNTKDSRKREKVKNDYLRNAGVRLIRVKETSSIKISQSKDILYYVPNNQYLGLDYVITKIIKLIGFNNNDITFVIDIDRDRTDILQNYIVSKKENSLENLSPELAREWHPTLNGKLLPVNLSIGSQKKVWWLCPKGHAYQCSISHRVDGNGCPICAGKKVLKGFNDLEYLNPELAKEWHNTLNEKKADEVTTGSSKKYWWRCSKCGYEYQASIKHRMHGTGCPVCASKIIIVGRNDLHTANPELAKEWHPYKNLPLLPTDVSRASGKKVWWLCPKCNHEWQATIHKRAFGRGCPNCYRISRTNTKKDK